MNGEHAGALVALLYLPVFLVGAAIAVDRAAAAGSGLALRQVAGYQRSRGARRLLVLLLAVSAGIHAGLVPGHIAEDLVLACLFALDAAALAITVGTGFDSRIAFWRPAAAALLVANLGAYAAYIAAGIESPDAVGVATAAVEALALILVIHPATAFVGTGERGNRPLESRTTRRTAQ